MSAGGVGGAREGGADCLCGCRGEEFRADMRDWLETAVSNKDGKGDGSGCLPNESLSLVG